mmetsp:Transcript_39442/g.108641  ORF Transcript_39442/g.108641 Transcript_39442/m.108641 type:complete len:192 (+) Transcript_39442:133-708(+)
MWALAVGAPIGSTMQARRSLGIITKRRASIYKRRGSKGVAGRSVLLAAQLCVADDAEEGRRRRRRGFDTVLDAPDSDMQLRGPVTSPGFARIAEPATLHFLEGRLRLPRRGDNEYEEKLRGPSPCIIAGEGADLADLAERLRGGSLSERAVCLQTSPMEGDIGVCVDSWLSTEPVSHLSVKSVFSFAPRRM